MRPSRSRSAENVVVTASSDHQVASLRTSPVTGWLLESVVLAICRLMRRVLFAKVFMS
jgi:hypothetical protein